MKILEIDDNKYIVYAEFNCSEEIAKQFKKKLGCVLIKNTKNDTFFLCDKVEDIEYEDIKG